MRLEGKAVVVTGSTTGIGEAIARRCVAEGARVLIHGRDRENGERVASELGDRAALHIDDLADPDAPERVVQAAVSAFGKLDAVCNNAAWVVRGDLQATDCALFDRVVAVNLRAPLLMIRCAFPHLCRSAGCVLNIGSVNAYCGETNQLAYSVSKGGLMTLTRNLADALARYGIRVNLINPGWVLTPNEYRLQVSEGMPSDWPSHVSPAFAPSGALMVPEDIAAAAVYWLGDESRPVSGSVVELEQYPVIGRNPPKGSE
ncbi:MAG: SDR family oxidoreductase [Actinomycetota bacterium]